MQTHHTLSHSHKHTYTYASLIYYSFLWPKSVTSCVTESSYAHIQQCIHRDTHTQHRYMYHVPFQQRGRVNRVFLYDKTASLLIVPFWSWKDNVWMDVKLSFTRAPGSHHRPSTGRKSQPCWTYNLTRRNQQTSPEGFGSRSGELHTATKSCNPEVLMYRGVFLCGCNCVWYWAYVELPGFPGAADWLERQTPGLQPLGLAAEHSFSEYWCSTNGRAITRFQIYIRACTTPGQVRLKMG